MAPLDKAHKVSAPRGGNHGLGLRKGAAGDSTPSYVSVG